MDNHPIPQDVTHFQFKLIGNLTIKQFGYVAAGSVLAWITISIHILIIVKLPIALLFAGLGILFAFIPIEGRPADMMLGYFFRAMFHPNQYLFQKQGSMLSLIETSQQKTPTTPLPVTPPAVQAMPIMQQPAPMQYSPLTQMPVLPQTTVPAPQMVQTAPAAMNTPQVIQQPVPKAQPIVPPMPLQAVQTIQPIPTPSLPTQPMPANLANQLQDVQAQKKQLEEQLAKLQQQITQPQQQPQIQPPVVTQTPQVTAVSPVIKTIAPPQPTSKLPLASDFPNIIMGVVRDARGNVLPNILIEVKDTDNNPVRAFKTNALGQFASATPLLNGTYTVLFEDPAKTHKFDAVQVAVTGEIMQPIEIISFDEREGLRKELFG